MEPNIRAMKAIWKDLHARLPLDDRRAYTTGFSGGARVANLMARVLGLAGVIAHGAGFPPSSPPDREVSFDFYALIGDLDFNYYEVLALSERLAALDLPHRIHRFDGGHQWARSELCHEAIDWMQRRAMARGLVAADSGWITAGWRRALSRAATAETEGRLVDAAELYREAAADFAPWIDVSEAERKSAELAATREVRRARRTAARWNRWAAGYLDRLARALEELRTASPPPSRERLLSDLEIRRLSRRARDAADERAKAARRVLNMVAVQTGFSQVAALRAAGDHARAATALEIAVAVAPDSPVHWYNLACYRALSGRPEPALDALETAFTLGFADPAAASRDEDLGLLHGNPRFAELLRRFGADPTARR